MGGELAQQHPTTCREFLGDDAVSDRHVIDAQLGMAGRADAGGVVDILQRVRHTVQRAAIDAGRAFSVCPGRIGAGTIGSDGDEGVDFQVGGRDAGQGRLGEGHAGGGAGA